MSRFDYVAYDEVAQAQQNRAKDMMIKFDEITLQFTENLQNIKSFISQLKSEKARMLAYRYINEFDSSDVSEEESRIALEHCYMWIGKAIRDDQIQRNGSAELQEGRSNS